MGHLQDSFGAVLLTIILFRILRIDIAILFFLAPIIRSAWDTQAGIGIADGIFLLQVIDADCAACFVK